MRSKRNRKTVRRLVRQAKNASKSPAFEAFKCPCGYGLKLAAGEENKTFTCPNCRGNYKASRLPDPAGGEPVLNVFSVDSPAAPEPDLVAPRDTSAPTEGSLVALRPSSQEKGVLDDAIEPEPPLQLRFSCPCGTELLADRRTYDKRAKCFKCGARLLVSLVYNKDSETFSVIPLQVGEKEAGS